MTSGRHLPRAHGRRSVALARLCADQASVSDTVGSNGWVIPFTQVTMHVAAES